MAERSFAREVEDLRLGDGDVFRGEGILAITKALLQSGVSYVGGYPGSPISHLIDVLGDAALVRDTFRAYVAAGVDVLSVQTDNLRAKLPADAPVRLVNMDSSDLQYDEATFDRAVLFFLLHEQPQDVRRRTIAETLRVVKPGGQVVIVDYAKPYAWNPLRWLFQPVLAKLEPFALDLWREDLSTWTPPAWAEQARNARRFFGGLYQKIVITR